MENEKDGQIGKGAEDGCLDGDGILLYDYTGDLLTDDDKQRFESHLSHCMHCQQKLTRISWFSQCLRESYPKKEKDNKPRAMAAS